MAFDWKNMLKKVAPFIGAAATGDVPALVGMAATAIGGALGKEVKPTADGIAAAMAGATPEDLLKLKEAEQAFAENMQRLGFEHVEHLEQIAAGDRDSARKREMEVKDQTPMLLACFVTLGFFGILLFMLRHTVPPTNAAVLNIMLGSLGTAWLAIVYYYFGSSSGSDRKTDIIAAQARGGD